MIKPNYRGPERRKYMRLDADCAINYVKLTKELKPANDLTESSYSENISAGGIKFISNESFQVGTILEMQIKIPTFEHFITTIGKVIRVEKKEKNIFDVALAFVWIKDKDIKAIDSYIRKKELERIQSELKDLE